MSDLLRVENHGPLILSTNFWELPAVRAGKFFVSLNAGAFRMLMPANQEGLLDDMKSAKGCAVSRGPMLSLGLTDAFEILFDDLTSDPFAMHLSPQAFDRLPAPGDVATEWVLSVWTQPRRGRPHKALERPCRYRLATSLPDLRPWSNP